MKDPADKIRKARERAARRERRKLERLQHKLAEQGELSDWEAEFSDSVSERLDKYGSAFHDPEKGRMSDALSFAQKKIMADMRKKARKLEKKPVEEREETEHRPPPKRPFLKLVKSGEEE